MAPTVLSARQLNRALLARQLLLRRRRLSVRDAVHAVAGLQSQEPRDPYVALWSRLSGFRAAQLNEAAARVEVVRGTYLRATIHTVSVDDFAAFRRLLQPVIDRVLNASTRGMGGFQPALLEAAARRLMKQGPLTARQMGTALASAFPRAKPERLAYWIRNEMALAMTPSDDRWGYPRPPRFAPGEVWIGRPLGDKATAADLILRGLSAIGPATPSDIRTWSSLPSARAVLEALRPRLRTFRDERGRELFDLPDAPRPRAETPAPVRFLPEFDNTLLSHVDRSRVQPDQHGHHFATANGRRQRAVLVDGFVRAAWTQTRDGDRATLRVTPFDRLGRDAEAAVSAEAEALLRFLEPDAAHFSVEVVRLR